MAMTDTVAKEIECVLCSETYSPVFQPEEDDSSYRIYCSSCTHWVEIGRSHPVRVTLKEVLGLQGEALGLAVQTYLASCHCGNELSCDAGRRCPDCIGKIDREVRGPESSGKDFSCPWDLEKLKKLEPKLFEYIFKKVEGSEALTLNQLIERFESGQIDAEKYMQELEDLQYREGREVCVIQTWAMMLGPEMAFRAAEENGLQERYGTRILVSVAKGLEMSLGLPILTTLSKEMPNWNGMVQKELRTFLAKIGGGF